jgi:SMC interacting uncharacterized protein involved in chromosome segregation
MSRTYKKEYTGSKKVDRSCRNHRVCNHCRDDRLYSDRKWRQAADDEVLDYYYPGSSEKDVDLEEQS